jgi:hypothetical protein
MKLIDILKSRWQEAMMVAGLQACCMMLVLDFQSMQAQPPAFEQLFFLGIAMALFGIISQMLFLGFLRTAAMGVIQSVTPMELLRTGRAYFWKMLLFQLILFIASQLIIVAIVVGTQMVMFGQVKVEEIPLWLNIVSTSVAAIILLKPMYFVPANLVRRDCGIWDAIQCLGQTRLLRIRFFLVFAVSLLVISGIIDYTARHIESESIFYYPILGGHAILLASGMLVLFVAAVLEVDRLIPKKTDEPNDDLTQER